MTDERKPESGSPGDSADEGTGDGLDAWFAANFPPPSTETEPEREPAPAPAPAPEPAPPSAPPPAPGPPVPPLPPVAAPSTTPPPPLPPDAPSYRGLPSPSGAPSPLEHGPPSTSALGEHAPEAPVIPPMAEELEGIPTAAEFPPPPTEAFADATGSAGIDALFGESKFVEYDEGPSATEKPFAKRAAKNVVPEENESRPRSGGAKPQTVLLWVAGSLLAALALVAFFILGTKLPALLGPAPGALVAPTATPTPTSTELPLGPVEPGEYRWDDLLGGECVDPYDGPWENTYTVVDCEKPHAAQLVTRGIFEQPAETTGFPGVEALQSQISLLCSLPTVVDYAKATAYTDIQFEASYAVSAEDWFDGNRSYNCFLSRSTGGEITGTVAMPQVAPTASPEPTD